MSGAPATVSAAPPGPAPAMAASTAVEPISDPAGSPGSYQSFTEVLSAQRAASGHDGGAQHDGDAKRGSSHEAKEAPSSPGSPSNPGSPASPSADDLPVAGSPTAPLPALADAVAAAAPADAAAAGASNGAAEDGTTASAATGAGEPGQHAPLSVLAASTGSTETTSSDAAGTTAASAAAADVPAALTETDSGTGTAGPDAPAGGAAVTAGTAGVAATAAATAALSAASADQKAGSSGSPVAIPSHGAGAGAEPGAGHGAPPVAEVASVAGSTPAAEPLPHLTSEGTLAPSDASRALASVQRPGAPAGPSAPTVAGPAASSLDLEGLSGSISRPLSDGNGTYTVTVALHPPELGHLQAVVSLDGNDLQVSLTAQTQTGHDALANAADALKNQLARGGVNVNVTLRDPGSQPGAEERYRPPTTAGGSFITEGTAAETPLPSGLVASQIHLVL